MVLQTETATGITHDIHVRLEDGEIEKFEGVLDVMKLPTGEVKFTHSGDLKQMTGGEIVRSRVNNVSDAHKYVCVSCESEKSSLITAADFGHDLEIWCPICEATQSFDRREP